LGFCAQDADDLETLLGELSSNVVRHANAEKYHVSVDFLEGRFIVTVIDKGVGFSIGDSVPATLRPDTLPGRTGERIGGLGLVMVHSIADNVQIQPSVPQGTTVRAEKRMKTPVSITTMAG
jgi:anti-sigma regulatory factor (Ser/Thr protein kinase)